jgi:hypothetical protein
MYGPFGLASIVTSAMYKSPLTSQSVSYRQRGSSRCWSICKPLSRSDPRHTHDLSPYTSRRLPTGRRIIGSVSTSGWCQQLNAAGISPFSRSRCRSDNRRSALWQRLAASVACTRWCSLQFLPQRSAGINARPISGQDTSFAEAILLFAESGGYSGRDAQGPERHRGSPEMTVNSSRDPSH